VKHQDFDSLLPAYFLGALSPAERRRVERHLRQGCGACEARTAAYRRVAAVLPLAAGERSPGPAAKRALMERLGPAPFPARRDWALWPRWVGATAAAAACVLALWAGLRPRPVPLVRIPTVNLSLRSGTLSQAGQAVTPGAGLAWGAALATSPSGPAEIRVGSRAVLMVKPGSRLQLFHDGEKVMAEMHGGCLFSAVTHGQVFSVQMGGVRVESHGTVFLVRQIRQDQAYVCICQGSIRVTAPGLDRVLEAADNDHRNALILSLARSGTQAERAKPAFYSDQEQFSLESALQDVAGGPPAPSLEEERLQEEKDKAGYDSFN
jgi:ferric-dicitrate binding protein FerR (iron transport regulator)